MLMIILAFIVGFITDIVWTRYGINVAKRHALSAANWSVGIYLCGIFATFLLVDKEYFAMFAYAVGGWLGTFFAVKHGVNDNALA